MIMGKELKIVRVIGRGPKSKTPWFPNCFTPLSAKRQTKIKLVCLLCKHLWDVALASLPRITSWPRRLERYTVAQGLPERMYQVRLYYAACNKHSSIMAQLQAGLQYLQNEGNRDQASSSFLLCHSAYSFHPHRGGYHTSRD